MRINALGNTATDFASDDYIAIDGATNGSRKMKNDSLMKVTAQNAIDKGIAASANNAGGIFVNEWTNNKGIYARTDSALGQLYNSDFSKCSGFIEINAEAIYFKRLGRSTDTGFGSVFYDANKTPISGITYGNQASDNSDFAYAAVPTGSKYVRFTYWMDTETYGEFSGFRIFNDAKFATGEKVYDTSIGKNPDEIVIGQNLSNSLCLGGYSKVNSSRLYVGFITFNVHNYGGVDSSQTSYFCTDFIDVTDVRGKKINYAQSVRNTSLSEAGLMFYDGSKSPIGGEKIVYGTGLVDGVQRKAIEVPQGASYVRISYLKVPGADYSLYFEKKASNLCRLSSFYTGGYINLTYPNLDIGSVISFSPNSLETTDCFITPCKAGEKFILFGLGGKNGRLYGFLDIDRKLLSRCDTDDFAADGLVITAPQDAAYLVINMRNSYGTKDVFEYDEIFDTFESKLEPNYSKLILGDYEDVIATCRNYLVRCYDDNGTSMFAFSDDLGKTWTTSENTIGDVVRYHFFSNGDILVVCNRKAYTTRDFQTFTESTIYDYDGSIFAPDADYFFANQNGDKLMYSDGAEIYMFGDYTLVSGSPSRLWYTTDNGSTIRCAAKFGTTVMDGEVRNIRHVHSVVYNEYQDCIYITTGDSATECFYIKAKYHVPQDEWEWEVIANGAQFKFGNHLYDEHFAYFVTDYTPDSQWYDKKGVLRCPIAGTDNYDNYTKIYKAPQDEWGTKALSKFIYDQNGHKVILPDNIGYGSLWFARQGFDFSKIDFTDSSVLLSGNVIGPNYNGDIYVTAYSNVSGDRYTDTGNLRLNRKVIDISKIIRAQLEKEFFKGYNIDCF